MRIIIDTSEQKPYSFDGLPGVTTARKKLATGDYSIEGLEHAVALERKSLDDWANTLVHAKDRFRAELRRLRVMSSAVIVIEGTIRDVLEKRWASALRPEAMLSMSVGVQIKWGIPVVFAGVRSDAREYVYRWLVAAASVAGMADERDGWL